MLQLVLRDLDDAHRLGMRARDVAERAVSSETVEWIREHAELSGAQRQLHPVVLVRALLVEHCLIAILALEVEHPPVTAQVDLGAATNRMLDDLLACPDLAPKHRVQ